MAHRLGVPKIRVLENKELGARAMTVPLQPAVETEGTIVTEEMAPPLHPLEHTGRAISGAQAVLEVLAMSDFLPVILKCFLFGLAGLGAECLFFYMTGDFSDQNPIFALAITVAIAFAVSGREFFRRQ